MTIWPLSRCAFSYFYSHKGINILQYLHCCLSRFSFYVLEAKCMSLDVLIEGILLLLVILHYFLLIKWNGSKFLV